MEEGSISILLYCTYGKELHWKRMLQYGRGLKMQKEIILQRLKENGCRITKQRKLLLDIILQEECESCKEIYYKAVKADPSIGAATVYRMVNLLEEIGAINRKNRYRISCDMECGRENDILSTTDIGTGIS